MNMPFKALIKIIIVLSLMFDAQCWAVDRGTADEAIKLVQNAIKNIKDNGRDKAFEEIDNPKGKFVDRDLYIFVYDLKGVSLAIGNGNAKKMTGKNLIGLPDRNGKYMIKDFVNTASTKGNGWVDYVWPDPVSGDLKQKTSYVERLDDMVIGCGVYK